MWSCSTPPQASLRAARRERCARALILRDTRSGRVKRGRDSSAWSHCRNLSLPRTRNDKCKIKKDRSCVQADAKICHFSLVGYVADPGRREKDLSHMETNLAL